MVTHPQGQADGTRRAYPGQNFAFVGTIANGKLRHGVWLSDGYTICGRGGAEMTGPSWTPAYLSDDRACMRCVQAWHDSLTTGFWIGIP